MSTSSLPNFSTSKFFPAIRGEKSILKEHSGKTEHHFKNQIFLNKNMQICCKFFNFLLQILYKQNYIFSISLVSMLEICLPFPLDCSFLPPSFILNHLNATFEFEWQEHAVKLGSPRKLPSISTSREQLFPLLQLVKFVTKWFFANCYIKFFHDISLNQLR